MSAIQQSTTVLNAQLQAIQNNNFLSAAQKALAISSIQAQIKQAGSYSGNTSSSPTPPQTIQQIFASQQALTQALGARAAAVTATPQFVQAKATNAPLTTLNQQLTQQGVYVTTPELNSFNNAIQGVPLTPADQANISTLLNRIQAPIVTGNSTSATDLYNFLQRSGALNPNPTPNVYSNTQSSPAAGGGYQPQTNQPQANIPPNYPNNPLLNPPQNPPPLINTPPANLTPPAGGGTSLGGTAGNDLTNPAASSGLPTIPALPTIPLISDLGTWLNGIFKTNIDPTLLGLIVAALGIMILLYLIGGIGSPKTFKSKLPPLTV